MAVEEKNWDNIPSLNLEMDTDYSQKLQAKDGRRHHRTNATSLKGVLHGDVLSLAIRVATAQKGVFDGKILDLSESGVRISIPKLLVKGEPTKVGFVVNQRTIIAKAVTRWVSPKGAGCDAGLEFQSLTADDKELLSTISSASLLNKMGSLK